MKGYENLVVWRRAHEFARAVYRITKGFPKEETFGVVSQLRRAVISIPTNIAEGAGRQNRNETRQFANIALGSLSETEYLLYFCMEEGLVAQKDYTVLNATGNELSRLLWRFYKSF